VSRRRRRRGVWGGVSPSQNFFYISVLKWRVWGGILAVNFFKFYSMNKSVKIHQNQTDTSKYDTIKRGRQ